MDRTSSTTRALAEAAIGAEATLKPGLGARVIFIIIGACLFALPVILYPEIRTVVLAISIVFMVACAWNDLTSFRVPNLYTYVGTTMLLAASAVFPEANFSAAALGAIAGGVAFLALSIISHGTVGIGDVKLAAFGGAMVGVERLLPALLVGSLTALVPVMFLLARKRITRKQALPYAPALAFGFIVMALLSGNTMEL